MKSYSDYQGENRKCLNCAFVDFDHVAESVGMPGVLCCELDMDGLLDIEDENGEIASRCPFWKDDKSVHVFDIETLNNHLEIDRISIDSKFIEVNCKPDVSEIFNGELKGRFVFMDLPSLPLQRKTTTEDLK